MIFRICTRVSIKTSSIHCSTAHHAHCQFSRRTTPSIGLYFSALSQKFVLSSRLHRFIGPTSYGQRANMSSITPAVQLASSKPRKTKMAPIKRQWWKEASVYQIYPASFKDSNGDGLGDIPGIISELDHVKKLGADIVWLSPILQSPQVDMGYDISDYKNIYPPYGTMADHDALIKGLHDRGMKYVLDLVVNHTSSEHEWFKQSRSSKDNPYRDWYCWRPARYDADGNRQPPNNWHSAFSGKSWEWDETTQEYYLHIFAKEQPDLNWENPKVVEAVHDIMRFWLDRGVDGFRMDVINFISKTPGLPDGEQHDGHPASGIEHFSCGPRLHEFFQGMGKILQEYDAFSVGEMPGVNDVREIVKAVGQDRGELAMAFQFEIVNLDSAPGGKWEPRKFNLREFKNVTNKWQTFMLENGGWNALYSENHDQARTVSRYTSDAPEYRTKASKMQAAHLALQSGTVFVYQGQELAQKNIPEDWGMDKYKDLESLNHWNEVLQKYPDDKEKQKMYRDQYRRTGRDCARTPIQWSSAKYAGFMPESTPESVKTWMDIHPDYKEWNAEKLVNDPDSTFHYWRRLLRLRKDEKDVFIYGDFEMLDMEHETVVIYVRTADSTSSGRQQALVLTNWGGEELSYKVPQGYGKFLTEGGILKEFRNYEEDNEIKESGSDIEIKLRPYEVIIAML